MITRRTHAIVSLLAALALGACATRASQNGLDARPHADVPLPAIRFDNDGPGRVHVYLIGPTREWLLGRVEPGANARLALPLQALTEEVGMLRLAVLAGPPATLEAAHDARAMISLPHGASALLEQRWTLAQGQLVPRWTPPARATRRPATRE